MKLYIGGGAKCGKSTLAQNEAAACAKKRNAGLYYVATMIATDEEDRARIRRHVEDRDGMGFTTIECGRDIYSLTKRASFDPEGVYLLDSVTALFANEMFHGAEPDMGAAERVAKDLCAFAGSVRDIVFVSDGVFSDAQIFTDLTGEYRKGLARIDREVSKVCDRVAECVYGSVLLHSPQSAGRERFMTEREGKIKAFVIGGAFQGKRNFIKETYEISDDEIFVCTEETTDIPEDARCVLHAERFVLGRVRQNAPVDVSAFFASPDRIVACEDISCGVVPADPVLRKWREETGILMRRLRENAALTIRVFCGIPQIIENNVTVSLTEEGA